jgi:hypothetical protein
MKCNVDRVSKTVSRCFIHKCDSFAQIIERKIRQNEKKRMPTKVTAYLHALNRTCMIYVKLCNYNNYLFQSIKYYGSVFIVNISTI